MAKLSTDELLDAFKEMTLLELSEFVKQFEETFGVTAAAPVAVAAAPARSEDHRSGAIHHETAREPGGRYRRSDHRSVGHPGHLTGIGV